MASITLSDIGGILLRSISIILFVTIYLYVVDLENKGCKCAESGDSYFIKSFSLFGAIYMFISIFIPHSMIQKSGNGVVSFVLSLVDIVFNLTAIYFFYVTYRYTRYLVNEKCKCSEDMRREIISLGSIIIFMLLFFFVVLQILVAIIIGAINGAITSISKNEGNVKSILKDPLSSISKLPSKIRSDLKEINSSIRDSASKLRKSIKSKGK